MAQILWERTNAFFKPTDSWEPTSNNPPVDSPTPTVPIPETFGPATPTKQWYNSKESGRDAHNTWMAAFWNRLQNPPGGYISM